MNVAVVIYPVVIVIVFMVEWKCDVMVRYC